MIKNTKFIKLSNNLKDVSQEFCTNLVMDKTQFVCPICSKIFELIKGDKLPKNSPISLEHLPPQSVGGRITTLTCKECNNKSGSLENELKSKFQEEKFFNKESGLSKSVNIEINDAKVNGKFSFGENGDPIFLIDEKRSNPKFFKKSREAFKYSNSPISLKVKIPKYNFSRFKFWTSPS